VVKSILLGKPAMIKEKTSELAGQKGVRLGPKGGSMGRGSAIVEYKTKIRN